MTGFSDKPLGGPAAWRGAAMESSQDWIQLFTADDIADIDRALASVKRAGLAWHQVTRESFPLDCLADTLAALPDEIENGRGLVLLRGLPVERYSTDELKAIHLGIGQHLGTPVYQSSRGEVIGEITDEGAAALDRGTLKTAGDKEVFLSSRARVQTTGPLRFHTDRTDVVTLLCVRPPAVGGASRIASAIAIHDVMLERRPDLLALLFEDYPRSRLGEEFGGDKAYYMLPVFALEDGHFTTHYSRTYVEAGQKLDHVPRMSAAQWEALDMLQDVADEVCLTNQLESGDIQYLNNHVMYHARDAYEDGSAAERRLLLRLWLAMPNSRPLPASHGVLFGATRAGAVRGGIAQPGGETFPATI